MRSQRLTFLFSLLLSAAVHATLLWQLPRWVGRPHAAAPKPLSYRVAPPGTLPDPPPRPQDTPLGEAGGVGKSVNSSPGDEPQSAPKSRPDQAAWTRDPSGQSPIDRPAPKPMQQAVLTPPPAALPTPPESKLPTFKKPPPPQPKAPPAEESRPTPPPRPPQPPSQQEQTAGRPMPHSDQDSDAFAREVTLEFKRGRVVAAPGRQIKFTKPRMNLASMIDTAEIALPARLRIRVSVTPLGKARNVTIVNSSGSRSIDRAFMLAAYDSWFEPAKDAAGQPVADEFEFNIAIE